jgi:type I site-specific restriction endonuclease
VFKTFLLNLIVQKLNFPPYSIQTKEVDGKTHVFDEIRKKHLVCTPEEWVRQHMIKYLINEKLCPRGLIALESGLKVNTLQKRSDILVYSKEGNPLILVECKAPSIKLSQETFDQAARYNQTLKAPYLMITNGLKHFGAMIDFEKNNYKVIQELPPYPIL